VLKDILSGINGAPKDQSATRSLLCCEHMILPMAKINWCAQLAQQDKTLYNDLKRELRDKLSEEEWQADLFRLIDSLI